MANLMIDIRDDVAVAKNYVACVYLACQSGVLPSSERAAMAEVCNAAREKLETVCAALDELLADAFDPRKVSSRATEG